MCAHAREWHEALVRAAVGSDLPEILQRLQARRFGNLCARAAVEAKIHRARERVRENVRIADGQRLVAEEVRRVKAQRRGERPLEVVLVVEVPAAEVVVLAKAVIEAGEILRVVDVVVGGGGRML